MATARTITRNLNLSVDDAWNAVALEERLELVSKAQAHGLIGCTSSVLLIGTIAYGFDAIWLLWFGLATVPFVFPLFASYSWRRGKPALILAYLAVRAVARRYAYGYNLTDLDIVLIYRGSMKELFKSKEEEALSKHKQTVDFDAPVEVEKLVWICLLRGGVLVLSERAGGAKLEFITPIVPELSVRSPRADEGEPANAVIIDGCHMSKGRSVVISSEAVAAQYVFDKQLNALHNESRRAAERLEALRAKQDTKSAETGKPAARGKR